MGLEGSAKAGGVLEECGRGNQMVSSLVVLGIGAM